MFFTGYAQKQGIYDAKLVFDSINYVFSAKSNTESKIFVISPNEENGQKFLREIQEKYPQFSTEDLDNAVYVKLPDDVIFNKQHTVKKIWIFDMHTFLEETRQKSQFFRTKITYFRYRKNSF